MTRIGIAYVDAVNLGDMAIYDTVRYIIAEIFKKHDIADYELIPIDIGFSRKKKKTLAHKIKSEY